MFKVEHYKNLTKMFKLIDINICTSTFKNVEKYILGLHKVAQVLKYIYHP